MTGLRQGAAAQEHVTFDAETYLLPRLKMENRIKAAEQHDLIHGSLVTSAFAKIGGARKSDIRFHL